MNLRKIAVFVCAMLAISIPASGGTLLDDIIHLPGKIVKEIPLLNQSPCKPYAYEVKQVCLRGNADLTKEQIEYTKDFAPNIIQCIHKKDVVWVEVLLISDQYSVRLFDAEKGGKAFSGGTARSYKTALHRLRDDTCRKGRSEP